MRIPDVPMHTWYKRKSVRWRKDWLEAFRHRCWVTGKLARNGNKLTVHHYPSEKQIIDKTLGALGLPHYKTISGYTDNELCLIKRQFKIELEQSIGVPLIEDIHKKLHKTHGKHPTLENMVEFKKQIKGDSNV